MTNADCPLKESFSEAEAAAALGISIARLHQLLDQYIFTQNSKRPEWLEFNSNDLLLLSYWNKSEKVHPPRRKVLQMPRRK
jgi:Ser/Thr protein kinase RdoA (MazF antagonist)